MSKFDRSQLLSNKVAHYVEATSLAGEIKNPRVAMSLLPSSVRGLFFKRGKQGVPSLMRASHEAYFDWTYTTDMPEMRDLYVRAKQNQWDSDVALPWSMSVDPLDREVELIPKGFFPMEGLRALGAHLNEKEQASLRADIAGWMLSQFLHGEQGALQAAAQVTESVQWLDGKLYGATQVMDEARHVEVFHRYLATKMGKLYSINDNLFVIIDALMRDSRWDMKFLGMQIMVEGLALGAFGTFYKITKEPLLRELLRFVIQDEARHVHYGVIALREHYRTALSPTELVERQDWAFEVALLMRNRFMMHEIFEEHFEGIFSRKSWNELVAASPGMREFRTTMFERLVPNLRFIGLLDARMEKHYADAGLMQYANGLDASRLSADKMIADLDSQRKSTQEAAKLRVAAE